MHHEAWLLKGIFDHPFLFLLIKSEFLSLAFKASYSLTSVFFSILIFAISTLQHVSCFPVCLICCLQMMIPLPHFSFCPFHVLCSYYLKFLSLLFEVLISFCGLGKATPLSIRLCPSNIFLRFLISILYNLYSAVWYQFMYFAFF